MDDQTAVTVRPARRVAGRLRVPSDKSISHRAVILSALARGTSEIRNLTPGQDVEATIDCLRRLGVSVEMAPAASPGVPPSWRVRGAGGPGGLAAAAELDARNSGTTTRVLMGVLAGANGTYRILGDASLERRPMGRVVDPLTRMGAQIVTTDGHLPAIVTGQPLHGIDYRLPVASAQVKSAILLAGVFASGETIVREPVPTRNHTELALMSFGVRVDHEPGLARVRGGQSLGATTIDVPGDPSSAAFWAAAAAALPGSEIDVDDVALNPTRTGFLDVLRRFGAVVETEPACSSPGDAEPRGRIRVSYGEVGTVRIDAAEVPGVIDELPVLAALATHGGRLTVTGAAELRVKESDRISALGAGLRAMGGQIEEFPDGFHVDGHTRLTGGAVDAAGDHRLAMAFSIAALGATGDTRIEGASCVAVSYPGFFDVLAGLCQ